MNDAEKVIISNFIINIRGGMQNAQHNLEQLNEWVEHYKGEDPKEVLSDLYNIRELIHQAVTMWEERQLAVASQDEDASFSIEEFDNVMFELKEILDQYKEETYGTSGGEELTEEEIEHEAREAHAAEELTQAEMYEHLSTDHDLLDQYLVDRTEEDLAKLHSFIHSWTEEDVDYKDADQVLPGEGAQRREDHTGRVQIREHDQEEPDEWYLEDYKDMGVSSEEVRERVKTSQTWTILHDHKEGLSCGDCEHWYVPEGEEVVDSGAEGSRFWTMNLMEENYDDLMRTISEHNLVGLVDEEAGGIVAYVIGEFEDEIREHIWGEPSTKRSTPPEPHPRYNEETVPGGVLPVTWLSMRHIPWEDWDVQESSLRLHMAHEHGFLPEDLGGHDDWILLGKPDFKAVMSLHQEDHNDYPEGGGGYLKHHHPKDLFRESNLVQLSYTTEDAAEVESLLQELQGLKKQLHHLASSASNKIYLGNNNVESMKLERTKHLSEHWVALHRNETHELANNRDRAKHHLLEARKLVEEIKQVTK